MNSTLGYVVIAFAICIAFFFSVVRRTALASLEVTITVLKSTVLMVLWPLGTIAGRIFFFLFTAIRMGPFGIWEILKGNDIPKKGAVILLPNHVGFMDPFFVWLAIVLKAWRMDIYFITGTAIYGPWIKLANYLKMIPAKEEGIKRGITLLNEGHLVVIFPEGWMNPEAYLIGGHKGGARMYCSSTAEITVIPVGYICQSSRDILENAKIYFQFWKKIRVKIGKPIDDLGGDKEEFLEKETEAEKRGICQRAIDRIMREHLAPLCGKPYNSNVRGKDLIAGWKAEEEEKKRMQKEKSWKRFFRKNKRPQA